MMPSSFPKGLSNENEITQPIIQFWQLNGSCPDGTIPIRRTTQKDLLIARSIKKKLITPQIHPSGDGGHHEYACVASSGKYYGATANMNVWSPKVQDNEGFSLSQFWIVGGFGPSLNTIEVGWIVYPDFFGGTRPRLFTYWTRDSYQKTGCYNLLCSGFVQLSKRIALGIEIRPQSSYHGPQHEIILTVWKDRRGTWWLRLGKEVIGYWPAALFTSLADGASVVQWGGELVTPILSGPHTTTQMGSGHFAEERFKGASYMRNLHVVDASNTLRSPGQFNYVVGNPNCYNLKLGRSRVWEDYFFYGGPGRNPKCP
ncbi:hypothetical protein ACH5RR_000604 [Cinchona calisaya]|uniref:Neprosin PEP catalytic domain-containing protein n=1 Tax=Cinchona calisaya TaxID=153742 RepID=A0ABD3B1N7_9GENT